jgi:hypothetical protein
MREKNVGKKPSKQKLTQASKAQKTNMEKYCTRAWVDDVLHPRQLNRVEKVEQAQQAALIAAQNIFCSPRLFYCCLFLVKLGTGAKLDI